MKRFVSALITACLVSCGFGTKKSAPQDQGTDAPPQQYTQVTSTSLPTPTQNFSALTSITIMTWNAENLYDAIDDPHKQDDSYLPMVTKNQIPGHFENCLKLSATSWMRQCLEWDWTQNVVDEKLSKMAQVILAVNNGAGPEILALQEIENLHILERFINNYMPQLGYKAYLIENNDARGIDVAVLTRLPVVGTPQSVTLGNSRPALQLTIELPDKTHLTMATVHFPMPSSSIEKRLSLLSKITSKKNLQMIVGDFNFPKSDMDSYNIAYTRLLPRWVPVHLYCNSCKGSTYESFTGDWSFLDMMLFDKQFFSNSSQWIVDVHSFRIHNPLYFQKNYYGQPADFILPSLRGISDHWPLTVQLVKIF